MFKFTSATLSVCLTLFLSGGAFTVTTQCASAADNSANSNASGEKTMPDNNAIKVGDKAPDFTLRDQKGDKVSLSQFAGKKSVVLYFYPKDETSVCTKEACLFRDSFQTFQDLGAEVIGVSSDSVDSHRAFAEHHNLPFILLSDKSGELRKAYGVPKTMGVVPGRVTYVIDMNGSVRYVFNSQLDASKHVTEAERILKEIAQK